MFIPFLAASGLAISFGSIGAMSVKISMLTLGLQAITLLAILLSLYIAYLHYQMQR